MDLIGLFFVPTSKNVLIVQMVHYFIFQDPGAIILQKREVDMQICSYIKTDSSEGSLIVPYSNILFPLEKDLLKL